MNQLPPLHALRLFESVARLKSFTAAANELHLTQSAVSHQIKNLEEYFGFPLLERRNRMPVLTEAGESLFNAAQAAFQVISSTSTQLKNDHGNSIRVKSFPSIGYLWLAPQLQDFHLHYPDIEISLTTVWEGAPSFPWEEYEYVILYGTGNWSHGGNLELLHEEVLTPLCAPALCQDGTLSLAELASKTVIHPSGDRADWEMWWAAAGQPTPNLARTMGFDTHYMAIAAAIRGSGVTISDPLFVREELSTGRLIAPFDLHFRTGRGYYLASSAASRKNRAQSQFRNWLFQSMRQAESEAMPRP